MEWITRWLCCLPLFFSTASISEDIEQVGYVVGGTTASISDAPWQAYVRIGQYYCGGVVIDRAWIITAAHCLDIAADSDPVSYANPATISVYTGTALVESANANFSDFKSSVSEAYAHESFNKSTFANDIAILKLSSAINAAASSVVMAGSSEQSTFDSSHTDINAADLQLTGWGLTDTARTQSTNTLQKTTLSGISDSACASAWGSTISGISGYQSLFVCANAASTGSCSGDSGGPLVWFDPSRAGDADGGATLIGIVSFGPSVQCAYDPLPDGYTQVSSFQSWISACQAGSCSGNSYTEPATTTTTATGSSGGGFGIIYFLVCIATGLYRQRK